MVQCPQGCTCEMHADIDKINSPPSSFNAAGGIPSCAPRACCSWSLRLAELPGVPPRTELLRALRISMAGAVGVAVALASGSHATGAFNQCSHSRRCCLDHCLVACRSMLACLPARSLARSPGACDPFIQGLRHARRVDASPVAGPLGWCPASPGRSDAPTNGAQL
jgi:hypothetical protein